MRNRKILFIAVSAAMLIPHAAIGQGTSWRVVAGTSANVVVAGQPAGARSYTDVLYGDVGSALVGARFTSPSTAAGYWAIKQGTWTRYTQNGVVGATLGPGRTGSESGHVFLDVVTGGAGAGADGQRAYMARAGESGNTAGATWGFWRWDTTRNIEVARVLTDGPLGPGLGTGWVFQNTSSFGSARAMNGGRVLINADVSSPTGATRRLLTRHVPGQGNVPCMLRDSTDATLAPGLIAGDYFDSAWGLASIALTPAGRIYGAFSASGSRNGIWEVCSGAPRALAVNGEIGARGPDIGISTATFANTAFGTPSPGSSGTIHYFASFRPAAADSSRLGLFWNDGTRNRPMAINDSSGIYGPGWQDTTWRSFDTSSLTSGGSHASFEGSVTTTDGGNPAGLWRVRAGGRPELVALIGLTGAYGPEPNRTWSNFYGRAIFDNGDIIVSARTNPGSELALWLLKPGGAPERVLRAGDVVSVPTTTGSALAAVNSFSIDNGASSHSGGTDGWAGADATVLVQADLVSYGNVRLMAAPSNLVDRIFTSGFDR